MKKSLLISAGNLLLVLLFSAFASKLYAQSSTVSSLLNRVTAAGNTLMDGCTALYDPGFNSGVDWDDAAKMLNPGVNTSYKRDGHLLAIERRQTFAGNDTLFLNLTGAGIHQYQWDISLSNMQATGRSASLTDKYLNTVTPLSLNGTTSVMFSTTPDAASSVPDRFMILFETGNAFILPVKFASLSAVRNADKTVNVKWNAENELNLADYRIEYSADGNKFAEEGVQKPLANNGGSGSYAYTDIHAPAGNVYYRIKASSINGPVQYSSIIKLNATNDSPLLTIYPNPVTGGKVNIRVANFVKGSCSLVITGIFGQIIHSEKLPPDRGNMIKTIDIGSNISAGLYHATVTDASGHAATVPFIVQ